MQLTALLNSISYEYESVVTSMQTLQDYWNWDGCVARLIDEGDRQKAGRQGNRNKEKRDPGGSPNSRALKVGAFKEESKCYSCKKRGNLADDCSEDPGKDSGEDKPEKKTKVKVAKKKKPSNNRDAEDGDDEEALIVLLTRVCGFFKTTRAFVARASKATTEDDRT